MKESKFIAQNKKNWQEFESDLRYGRNKPNKLSHLFIQITDDLSFVRTFYNHRSVKIYLNGIAQHLFNDLYQNHTGSFKGFINFWKKDLPLLIHDARKEFRISFIIFLLAFGIGILSSIYDSDFPRLILGSEYINMTTENIRNNDPMAVYKSAHETHMFLGITLNNLMVSLITFLSGIFFSIGTVFKLIYNGVMVGVFQYFFIERGLFKDSFLAIWQHGTLEISSIIIAGAAGITLGKGLIFPETYSRLESFKISALRGLKIFLGITPIIIMAAFIESFITRHTELGTSIRMIVIALSFLFIMFYFVWYPHVLSKRLNQNLYFKEKPSFHEVLKFDFSRILTAEEILGYTFKFISEQILWVLVLGSLIAFFHAAGAVFWNIFQNNDELAIPIHTFISFFKDDNALLQFLIGILTLGFLQSFFCLQNRKLLITSKPKQNLTIFRIINLFFSSLLSSLILLSPFVLGVFWGICSLVLLSPIIFLAVFQSFEESIFILAVFPRLWDIMSQSWGKLYWNSIKIFLFLSIIFILFQTPFVWQYIESIYQSFNVSPKEMYLVGLFVYTSIIVFIFCIYFIFQMSASVYSYFAFKETVYAENLKERINRFGERNIMFGFEKEG